MGYSRALSLSASLAALALSSCVIAVETDDLRADRGPAEFADPEAAMGVIDIRQSAPVSLALRGGIGPILEGQTVDRAAVLLNSIQLISVEGTLISLLDQPTMIDLISVQNSLDQLVSGLQLPPGQFTGMRFGLEGAFIEVMGPEGGAELFATPGMDLGAFGISQAPGPLELMGMQPGGFVDVAIPPQGIAIDAAASLALQFDLAQSLSFQNGVWAMDPRVWVVDQSIFSSLDVAFDAAQVPGFQSFATQGFEVMLFDAAMRPISTAPLGFLDGGMPGASFHYLAPFQGPFVAVLLPPPGVQLASAVSVSVSLEASVHAQTSIVIDSFHEVRREGGVAIFDIAAARQASVIQRGAAGAILSRGMSQVGPIAVTMPRTRPQIPLLPGQSPAPVLRHAPFLRGLPRPVQVGPNIRPGGPPILRERPPLSRHPRLLPGEQRGFPGPHRPGALPGERRGFPGAHRPGALPGERRGFPGKRAPGLGPDHRFVPRHEIPRMEPGQRRGIPGERAPVTRPGQRRALPGEGVPSTRPGRGRGLPSTPGVPGGHAQRATPAPLPQLQEPTEGRVPRARRPGDFVSSPVAPPAHKHLHMPEPLPEPRRRLSTQEPIQHEITPRRPTVRSEREDDLQAEELFEEASPEAQED